MTQTLTPQRTIQGWERERTKNQKPTELTGGCHLIQTRKTMDVRLSDFEIVSYACGDKLDTNHSLTFDHFEFVHLMKSSRNPKEGGEYYHFFCTRGEQETFVVAKLK